MFPRDVHWKGGGLVVKTATGIDVGSQVDWIFGVW